MMSVFISCRLEPAGGDRTTFTYENVVKLELHAAETRAAHYFIEQSNGACIRIPFDVVQVVRSEEEENTKTEESGLRGESE